MNDKRLSYTKNATYNTLGVFIYSFCLWLTTFFVVRLSDDYANAGIWQLAISITNVFATIAVFNLTTYYVSDVNDQCSESNYLGAQLVTCIGSLILCVAYSVACGYTGLQLGCIIVYMICRAVESYIGILYGAEQRNYRMDYVGISYAIRGILELLGFVVFLKLFNNIVFATIPVALVSVLMLLVFDIPSAKKFISINPSFSLNRIKQLLKEALPSVLSVATITAISTIPRQIYENKFDAESLGFYATVAAPIVALQVIIINLVNPILRDISIYYKDGKILEIRKIVFKGVLLLLGITLIAIIGAKILGEYAYTLIYGGTIRNYCYLMYAIIVSVVLYSSCYISWNMLVVMRKSKIMVVTAILSLIAASIAASPMIVKFGANGISFSMILAYCIYQIISIFYIVFKIKLEIKKV